MKLLSKLAVTSAVLALTFVSIANAQTMRVSIPFGFSAGDKVLPAGEYRVELNRSANRMLVNDVNGKDGCFLAVKVYRESGAVERGSLIFNRYGDRYFLAQVNAPGASQEALVFSNRTERESAKAQAGVRTVVPAASSM